MDYTDLASVKAALDSTKTTDDAELAIIITAVSRALDRKCTESVYDSENYFMLETVTDELLRGRVANGGSVLCHPKKSSIASVSEISYRYYPQNNWATIDPSVAAWDHRGLKLFTSFNTRSEIFLKITYVGGLWAAVENVAADFKEAATILAVRYYKERKSGLGDVIGVAELGTLIYTKSWPSRVLDLIRPYKRISPWT